MKLTQQQYDQLVQKGLNPAQIENLAKKSQLILITHNRETMSRAGILYGVTMGSDGVSKLLSVKFEEAVAVAK